VRIGGSAKKVNLRIEIGETDVKLTNHKRSKCLYQSQCDQTERSLFILDASSRRAFTLEQKSKMRKNKSQSGSLFLSLYEKLCENDM